MPEREGVYFIKEKHPTVDEGKSVMNWFSAETSTSRWRALVDEWYDESNTVETPASGKVQLGQVSMIARKFAAYWNSGTTPHKTVFEKWAENEGKELISKIITSI